MYQITQLRRVLQPHLGWHGARLTFVALFLIALFRVKTVNLAELATAFCGKTLIGSHYKRLQRFFSEFEVDYPAIAQTVARLMQIPEPWVLSIDRTEWQFGGCIFNILTLGIVHEGIAFPVVYFLLDQRGNSNTDERIDFIQEFFSLFEQPSIAFLTADREFIGKAWLDYLLHRPKLPFRIRIRESELLSDGSKSLRASVLFADLQPNQVKVLTKRRRLWGRWVYVAATRLEDRSLLLVITDHAPQTALLDYAKPWGIETLFGAFKTRGFCLESTHFIDQYRLRKLVALLSLALCWAFLTGLWLHQSKPLKLKSHGRREKSLFRYGFDHIRNIVLNLDEKMAEFLEILQFLSCT
jgi:hypothetical protein